MAAIEQVDASHINTMAPATTNRACMLLKPRTIEIQDIGIPEIGPDEVLVECVTTGICGSDVSWAVPLLLAR